MLWSSLCVLWALRTAGEARVAPGPLSGTNDVVQGLGPHVQTRAVPKGSRSMEPPLSLENLIIARPPDFKNLELKAAAARLNAAVSRAGIGDEPVAGIKEEASDAIAFDGWGLQPVTI